MDLVKPFYLGENASDGDRTKSLETCKKILVTLEERFKDGRTYAAGEKITAADFALL